MNGEFSIFQIMHRVIRLLSSLNNTDFRDLL